MKINNQFREKYYPLFVEKAACILGVSIRLSPMEARDLARDFTSAFFYSNSLMKTFDPSQGDIEPFFSSWVRRTLMSYTRGEYQWRNFTVLEEWMKGHTPLYSFEFDDWFRSILNLIEGRVWVSGDTVVPYARVFKAASIQVLSGELWGGSVVFKKLAKTLGIRPLEAQNAFLSLKEILIAKRSQGLV